MVGRGLSSGVVLGSLLACTGVLPTPVPEDRADYVGSWAGGPVTLVIAREGMVEYERDEGNVHIRIEAPIQAWHERGFDAGLGPLVTTFLVTDPPHHEDGDWTMTVDGHVVTRR